MSDMKCPICGQELKNINLVWFCENESCRAYDWTMEEAAWQELIRTRKALEIAVDALKSVRKNLCEMPDPSGATIFRMACESATTVKKALEQITALEQKDK